MATTKAPLLTLFGCRSLQLRSPKRTGGKLVHDALALCIIHLGPGRDLIKAAVAAQAEASGLRNLANRYAG